MTQFMCTHIVRLDFYLYFAVEFPAVLLDLQTGKVVDEFQQYVLPRDNPKLSDFCKTLTGISQVLAQLLSTFIWPC